MKIVYKIYYVQKWERFAKQPTLLWELTDEEFDSEESALDYMDGAVDINFTIVKIYKK